MKVASIFGGGGVMIEACLFLAAEGSLLKLASIFGGGGVMIQAYVLGFFSPSVRARLQNAAKSSSDFPHGVGTKTCWRD